MQWAQRKKTDLNLSKRRSQGSSQCLCTRAEQTSYLTYLQAPSDPRPRHAVRKASMPCGSRQLWARNTPNAFSNEANQGAQCPGQLVLCSEKRTSWAASNRCCIQCMHEIYYAVKAGWMSDNRNMHSEQTPVSKKGGDRIVSTTWTSSNCVRVGSGTQTGVAAESMCASLGVHMERNYNPGWLPKC